MKIKSYFMKKTNIPSVTKIFAESADLQKNIKVLVNSNTLSKSELTILEEKVDDVIDVLEKLKAARS